MVKEKKNSIYKKLQDKGLVKSDEQIAKENEQRVIFIKNKIEFYNKLFFKKGYGLDKKDLKQYSLLFLGTTTGLVSVSALYLYSQVESVTWHDSTTPLLVLGVMAGACSIGTFGSFLLEKPSSDVSEAKLDAMKGKGEHGKKF